MKLQFKNWLCTVVIAAYRDGGPAIQLVMHEDDPSVKSGDSFPGEPIATASVNLSDWFMQPGEIAIKAYSENEGAVDELVKGGLLLPAHIHLDLNAGFHGGHKRVMSASEASTYVGLCRFTDAAKAAFPELAKLDQDDDEDECDECGELIPVDESSEVNAHHAESCSLHPDNLVSA